MDVFLVDCSLAHLPGVLYHCRISKIYLVQSDHLVLVPDYCTIPKWHLWIRESRKVELPFVDRINGPVASRVVAWHYCKL